MAHVFFADQKDARNQPTSTPSASDATLGKKEESWRDSMGYIFDFLEWWNRYRIFRLFSWMPIEVMNGWGNVLGTLVLRKNRKLQKKVIPSLKALLPPSTSEKRLIQLYDAYCKYMGKLVLAFLSGIPVKTPPPGSNFMTFERLDILDRELEKGKGVILLISHLGELTQVLWGLLRHPKKYTVATVVYVPHMGIYDLFNDPYYTNMFLYASTSFANIVRFLESHLRRNHVVVIFHDYGSKRQLRVPFREGKVPYLLHSPQSHISLHRRTSASILVGMNVPDGIIGKTRLKILENHKIMETSRKYWNAPKKEFHGMLSTAINSQFNPYICAYCHVWEQITHFASERIGDRVKYAKNITLEEFLVQSFDKMSEIIEMSFEPGRNDTEYGQLIDEFKKRALSSLEDPQTIFRKNKTKIDLSRIGGRAEIIKLGTILRQELTKCQEMRASQEVQSFLHAVQNL